MLLSLRILQSIYWGGMVTRSSCLCALLLTAPLALNLCPWQHFSRERTAGKPYSFCLAWYTSNFPVNKLSCSHVAASLVQWVTGMKEVCGLQWDSRRWFLPLSEWFSWRSIWALFARRYKAPYKVQDRGRQINLAQEEKSSLWNMSKSCTDAAITLKTHVQASRKDLNDAELEMVAVDLL